MRAVPPVLLVSLFACSPRGAALADDRGDKLPPEIRTTYAQRCAICHGATGEGNGPSSVKMERQPQSFADAQWQKTVTDEQLRAAITDGGKAVGKSDQMPASPDLKEKGKSEVLVGLVRLIRSFGKR